MRLSSLDSEPLDSPEPSVYEPQWREFFDRLDELNPIPPNWRSNAAMNAACEFADLAALEVEMKFLVGRFSNFDELIAPNAPTSIHHLYHLARWESATGHKVSDLGSVLEWGGGYGSMARLVKILNPTCRYTIVDHAPMLRFAAHFLDQNPTSGSIEFIKNDYSPPVVEDGYDLFLSTWALSESGTPDQDFVFGRNLFNTPALLLGFNVDAGFIGSRTFNEYVDEIPGLREPAADGHSEYLFR